MQRTKLADRKLPDYTLGEEIFNSVSHIVGAVFGIFVLVSCVVAAAFNFNGLDMFGAIVYGVCTIFMYTMSGVYHGLKESMMKKVLQIIDHCGVFLMVAGTYTPVMLSGLYKADQIKAIVLLSVVWASTIVGVVLNSIDLKKFHIFSVVNHLVTGWASLTVIVPLYKSIGLTGFLLIFGGGILYTIGAVLYSIGKSKRYFHSVFHVFVLAGSVVQYLGIIIYMY